MINHIHSSGTNHIKKILNKYPEIKKMKEQLDLMLHLVKEHENEPNS